MISKVMVTGCTLMSVGFLAELNPLSPVRINWLQKRLTLLIFVRWSSSSTDILEVMRVAAGEQLWQQIQMGHETAFKTVTGGIFQFGFTDSILQMWAAFLYELEHGDPISKFAGCVTPDEAAMSHRLFTAALASERDNSTVTL